MLGRFATGVTVVTVGGAVPHCMTVNAFTSVSLDPPLVLVCIARDTVMLGRIRNAGRFAVCVLAAGQEDLARHFADRRRPMGAAQLEGVRLRDDGCTGAPLIHGALAWLECRLWRRYDGGDHDIVVGRLLSAWAEGNSDPLTFFGGWYGRHHPTEPHRQEPTDADAV